MSEIDPEIRDRALNFVPDITEGDAMLAYQRELEDGQREVLHVRWMLDGCENLPAMADVLRAIAAKFEERDVFGWALDGPIVDGHIEIVSPELQDDLPEDD